MKGGFNMFAVTNPSNEVATPSCEQVNVELHFETVGKNTYKLWTEAHTDTFPYVFQKALQEFYSKEEKPKPLQEIPLNKIKTKNPRIFPWRNSHSLSKNSLNFNKKK